MLSYLHLWLSARYINSVVLLTVGHLTNLMKNSNNLNWHGMAGKCLQEVLEFMIGFAVPCNQYETENIKTIVRRAEFQMNTQKIPIPKSANAQKPRLIIKV